MLANDITPTTFENDIPLDLARSAHAGTSFVPERRGDQERASYAAQLALDYNELAKLATTDEKRATLAAEFARYRSGYRTRYIARLSAMSRCVSTMIAGPSNFNTRRHGKSSDRADKRTTDVCDYREAALAAIRKALQPELRPVMAGDGDAVERLTAKIAKLEAFQAQAKAINACIRKHAKGGIDAQVAALVALELPGRDKRFSEETARALLKPDFAGRIGIPAYELTNNNANIRRLKERLAAISVAKVAEVVEAAGDAARFEDNPGENRVRLYFPGKPSAEVRTRLKTGGFRWTPTLGCWQAYRSDRTISLAKREAGVVVACDVCKDTGEVYTARQVTESCGACEKPTHPSDSNDDGVCSDCLGPAAIFPEGA